MTIQELKEKCEEQIAQGNGDRTICLCVNETKFYSLEAGFSSPVYNNSLIYDYIDESDASEDETIVLN